MAKPQNQVDDHRFLIFIVYQQEHKPASSSIEAGFFSIVRISMDKEVLKKSGNYLAPVCGKAFFTTDYSD